MVTSHAYQVFDDYAERYDAWCDSPKGQTLLATEVECLRPLLEQFLRPYLELGVGTGRFAQALGLGYGLEPSRRALERARRRGVEAVQGIGEALPFKSGSFGGVLVAFTLCFVQDSRKVMEEIQRVVVPGGGLVLGLLLKGTPWADFYARRGAEGHPLYAGARFSFRKEVEDLLERAGFRIITYRSTLFQEPGLEVYKEEQPVNGYVPGAGFVGIAAVRVKQRDR